MFSMNVIHRSLWETECGGTYAWTFTGALGRLFFPTLIAITCSLGLISVLVGKDLGVCSKSFWAICQTCVSNSLIDAC